MRKGSRKGNRVGIRKVTVPNLYGLTRTQAQSILSALGLIYSESSTSTSNLVLDNTVASQDSSYNSTVLIGASVPFSYYYYINPVVYTYGPCEAYGSGSVVGTGNQCSGEYYQEYTDYQYDTRKKIYADGVWDGSSYTSSGCSPTTSRSITSSSQVNGQCGYVTPPTITYGPCEAYGSPTQNLGSGTRCSGDSYQEYTDYRYNTRKKVYANGVWDGSSYSTDGCGTIDSRVVTSSNQINGLCGYVAPCSVTSYSDWSYGNISWSGNCPSGTESGTAATRSRTDNCGNTYNESGSYSVTRSCTPPVSITYGSCEAYGDAVSYQGAGSYCSGTTTITYETWLYNARRTILQNGSWNGYSYDYSCGQVSQQVVTGQQQINGSCGCCPVVNQWYCTESYNGGGVGNCGYSMPGYDNSGSGSGFSRQCVYGTSYPSCQSTNPAPVCTSYKYQCKSYDVTNSASNNYFTCYSVGECAANNNSDGSRATCCASYA
jgi:hypothetical protein